MNILTFDIEDWYNCDFISGNLDWDNYEVRIYDGVNKILDGLDEANLKGSFFCLGWLAEKHPSIIKEISKRGHHIGCHSYQHQLSTQFNRKEFRDDTLKAKTLIEDCLGLEVNAFRAPGFSITENNLWAFEELIDMNFKYDCSVFPAHHDYGGMPNYGNDEPAIIKTNSGIIKEFPINIHSILGKNVVFSGGGFFRFFPYLIIKSWAKESSYLMTYFHPRDFDIDQPVVENLPLMRKFKSYVGIKNAFSKWQKFMNDFEFVNIEDADKLVNWDNSKIINI